MKTGECKYGAQCRFHHPIDRPAVALSTTKPSHQENVKLTLAGLPRREVWILLYRMVELFSVGLSQVFLSVGYICLVLRRVPVYSKKIEKLMAVCHMND